MKITTITTAEEHEPVKQPCTLLGECRIEPGTSADYKLLSAYHYRDTGYPPAVHQVYRAVHAPSGRVVGAIVYAAPALNLGIRNKIFGDRYKIGGHSHNKARSSRLNSEVELIIRVVIHPTFRGTGLGQRIIAETMVIRPYRYIEMSAAMGSINPFAAKAGMKAYAVARPVNTERVLAALRSLGIDEDQASNPADVLRAIEAMPKARRAFIEKEIHRYAERWIKSRAVRDVEITTPEAVRRIAGNALLTNWYYLHENKISE